MAQLDRQVDYYRVLGVRPDCSPAELKRHFHLVLHRVHPDHGGDAGQTHQVMQAYRVLSDPASRERYDRLRQTSKARDQKPSRLVVVVDDQRQAAAHIRWALYGTPLTSLAVQPTHVTALMSLLQPEVAIVSERHLSVAKTLEKRGIPVVILVDKQDWPGVIRAANAGYHHLLLKPFTTRSLTDKLNAAVAKQKSVRG